MAVAGIAYKGTEAIVGEVIDIFLLGLGLSVAFIALPRLSSITQQGIATIQSV
jgi:hypothetical protein